MENETTIHEVMEFLRDNMVTKAEAKNFATKDDLKNFATKDDVNRLAQKIDEFDNRMTIELRAITNELEEIKARLTALECRTKEDADAAARDILQLRRRVEELEKQVLRLQGARA